MKAIATLVIYALLVVSTSAFNTAAAESPQPSPARIKAGDKKSSQEIMKDLKTEIRKGEAVKLRANQLRRKNKAVAQAMKDLENSGLQPAFEAGSSIIAISKSGNFKKAASQETTIVDGDYELTFISYNDGNNATWEGIIYFKRPEGEAVYSGQFDISTSDLRVLRETQYMGIGDGSTQLMPVTKNTQPVQLQAISYNPGQPVSVTAPQGSALQEWAECAATGCISAGVGCYMTGPGWAACAAIACLVVMLGCALDALW